MKRVLLGTTALVAAGLLVTSVAYADDEMMEGPVTVGVGGYTTGAIGFYSDSDDANRGHDISYVYEIGVSGSTTLDNGITVAVSGQIGRSGKGNDDNFDEIHTTLSGSFGSLRLGRTESAAFNATVAAPGAAIGGMIGVNYGWFAGATSDVNTYSGLMEDALKVVYTSPNFNGLTIGLSYAPENSEANFAGRAISDGLGGHTAVGATYSTDFMEGGSLTLGAAYETADMEGGGTDPSATKFGIGVGIDQISVGGSMYDHDMNGSQFDVGASWTEGSIEIGIQYALNEANSDGNETTKAGASLTYTLGPGILIGGQAAIGTVEGMDDDVTQVMLGTAIFF